MPEFQPQTKTLTFKPMHSKGQIVNNSLLMLPVVQKQSEQV
jgi:hypothetical protein